MSPSTSDPTDGFAVDCRREECHLDAEGYLHTGTASPQVDRVILRSSEQRR